MPPSSRKRTYKRRSRRPTYKSMYRIAKQVAFREKEPKRAIVQPGSTNIGTTWTNICTGIDTIVQGDSSSSRDGNLLYAKGLKLDVLITPNDLLAGSQLRIMLVREYQSAGLTASDFPSGGVHGILSVGSNAKYKVLMDKTFNMPSQGLDLSGLKYSVYDRYLKKYVKLGHRMKYSTNATTVPIQGAISLWVVSANNTNQTTVNPKAMLYFKDL